MTPEGKVKAVVKERLRCAGAYYHMPVQNGMGAPTLDIVGSHLGRYFAIETKAPGGKPTPRQEDTIDRIRISGGKVFVIDGSDFSELDKWLGDDGRQMNLF
tara:strand:- start:217 stop:519 length:303 start_codon:yes stop_codon:yes gene_type:complete